MAIRQAGYNERRCISRDSLGLYGWIAVTGQYKLDPPCLQSTWRPQIFSAVNYCMSKHAALSAVVKDARSSKPQIAQLDQVRIQDQVRVLSDVPNGRSIEANLRQLLHDVHHHKLVHDGARPQWQLVVLPTSDVNGTHSLLIAFACSHVLLDGMSCYKFQATLFEGLRLAGSESEQYEVWHASTKDSPLPPALDKATDWPISWSFLLKPLLDEFLPSSLTSLLGISTEVKAWHGADKRPSLPAERSLVPTSVHIASLSASEVDRSLKLCRSHDSKFTSLFNHLFARSLSEALEARGIQYKTFQAEVPFDLRRCMPGTDDCMANYPSAIDTPIDVSSAAMQWQVIAEDTQRLQRASSSKQDQPIALLKYLSDFDEWVNRRATQPPSSSFSTSNLGAFVPPTTSDGGWAVEEMIFSQSADATGAPINVNLASSKGGRLWIVTTWWAGMLGVSDEAVFMKEVCDSLTAQIRVLINER